MSREAEILAALGEGLPNARIASRLHLSVRTVEGHVSALLRKYGVAGRADLAALAGAAAAPGTIVGLPAARTSFVGRDRERAEIVDRLATERLITLVGPGGVGKTRLAAVAAAEAVRAYPAGGAYVDLVPAHAGSVAQAVAAALGVAQGPLQPLPDAITGRLARGRILLVLDNCEHVVDTVAAFADTILAECPGLTILATSRERLAVPGEHTIPIGPLPLGSDAERLYAERAAETDPGLVSELCARLDGLPLAIELAAARSRALGGPGLAAGLGDALRLLAGGRGSTARHRSLRSVLDWSHDLLDPEEQTLFRRLGVFAGGFDLAAVTAVAGLPAPAAADLAGRLADKSLLTPAGDGWRMLATIRAYALDRLRSAGEDDEVRRRHREWAWRAGDALRQRTDAGWADGFDAVAGDLRAALAGAVPDAHRLARLLGCLTFARRFFAEAEEHYRTAAELAPDPAEALLDGRNAAAAALRVSGRQQAYQHLVAAATDPAVRARALAHAVVIAHRYTGQPMEISAEETAALLAEAHRSAADGDPATTAALATARAWTAPTGGAAPAEATATATAPTGHVAPAETTQPTGHVAPAETTQPTGHVAAAEAAVAAARTAGDPVLLLGALDALGYALAGAGRHRAAHRVAQQRLPLLDRIPRHEPYAAIEVMDAHLMTTAHAVGAGDLTAALADATGDGRGAYPYLGARQILALALAGRFGEALARAETMWADRLRHGRPPMRWLAAHAYAAALVCGLRGDDGEYATWRDRAVEIAGVPDPAGAPLLAAVAAFVEARLAVHHGPGPAAAALIARATAELPEPWYAGYALAAGAELAVVTHHPDAAGLLARAEPAGRENDWVAATLRRAHGRLTGDARAHAAAAGRFEQLGARFEHAATLLLLPDRAAEGRTRLAALGVPGD